MEEHVKTFLRTRFNAHADNVVFIGEGWFSQAFAFDIEDQKLILRLNKYDEDFLKDQFAHTHFPAVLIPKVIQIGRFDEKRFFAITERCAGEALKESGSSITVTPSLFKTLDTLRQLDTAPYPHWGLTDARGSGRFGSWGDYLLSLHNQKFEYDWRTLIRNSFIERDLFQTYYDEMRRLVAYCPPEKYIVHGDYGFINIIADGDDVTGVLDWAEWKLGDFLYDVMYLDFWSDDIQYGSLWRAEHTTPHFVERMRCYTLHQGLGALAIAAVKKDEEMYTRVKDRMIKKLRDGQTPLKNGGAEKSVKRIASLWFVAPSGALICLLSAPLLALLWRAALSDFFVHITNVTALNALILSLLTSTLTAIIALITGTPLAYTLARWKFRGKTWVELLIDLPVVLPPSVAGLALLIAFGRRGVFGDALSAMSLSLPFTTAAVVIAQTFVSAPLYVRAARIGFAHIDKHLEEIAHTEGATRWQLFRYVMIPLSVKPMLSGLVLCWTRALGEFGATILFAGNLEGRTQTMPLAIYIGFESDLNVALALSALLLGVSIILLTILRRLEDGAEH